jgi:hypothetical protein
MWSSLFLAWLTHCLVFVGAFARPARYDAQPIPWQNKVRALTQLARTGDPRDCEKVLATIRGKQRWAETCLKLSRQAMKDVEVALADQRQRLRNPGRMQKQILDNIDDYEQSLALHKLDQRTTIIMLHDLNREEAAFARTYKMLKAVRCKNPPHNARAHGEQPGK